MRFPGFIGPSYTSQSINSDCQRCVNLFPEINALGTGKEHEVAALVSTPGLRLLLTLAASPIRGVWTTSGNELFVVGGTKLYKISSSFVATEIGTLLTDTGPVSMADNGIQLMLVDGPYGYVCTLATSAYVQITDPDFPGSTQVVFQDGYFIFIYPNSGKFGISGLNAVTFEALDIATAERSPDRLVGLISTNQNVQLFGTQSIEVYYNSGDASFPFARTQGAVIDVGCSAPYSIAKMVGATYWVGGDKDGSGIVYRMQGYQAQKISTPAIEAVLRSITSDQLLAATAYTYQQGGHVFYCLNLPGTLSTWVYDASTEFWHERTFLNLWSQERHRAENHTVAFGLNIVGDYISGNLYALDASVYTDNGTSIVRIRQAPHISEGMKLIRHNGFQLDMETGVGLDGSGQGIDPQVMLAWSDNGGHSWSNEYWISAGAIGERRKRVKWRRLGMSRDRVYQIKITDPVKVVLIGAELEVEGGVA